MSPEEQPVEFVLEDEAKRRITRRRVLIAAGAGTLALAGVAAALLAGPKGAKRAPATGRTGIPVPPTAKTEKAHRRGAPPSPARAGKGVPPEVHAYVMEMVAAGALVLSTRTGVIHHPVLCKDHLGGVVPPRRKHRKPRGAARKGSPAGKGPAAGKPRVKKTEPVLHERYTDGIVYSLLKAENDEGRRTGLAVASAVAWPQSAHFADLAIRGLREGKEKSVDEVRIAAALGAARGRGGADASVADRARQAKRVLDERLAARAVPKPRKRQRHHGK